jgi:hypothetical protein
MTKERGFVVPNDRCLLTELGDGTGVLLHLDTKFYYTLNRTGLVLWKAATVAPRKTADDLALRLAEAFTVDEATAKADVNGLLRELDGEGLISFAK